MTAFDRLRDWEPPSPRPIWVWLADIIGLLLVAVNSIAWPLLLLAVLR